VPDRKILDEARNEDFDADQYPRSCTTSRLRCSSFKLSTDIAAALTFPGSCCTRSRLRCLWLRSSSSATAASAAARSVASTNPRNRLRFPMSERPQVRGLAVLFLMVDFRARGRNDMRAINAIARWTMQRCPCLADGPPAGGPSSRAAFFRNSTKTVVEQ